MKAARRDGVLLGALWLAVVASALLTRPLFAVDETRYLSVAWEMWWRRDFLLPWLNGEPYPHKPPLLFWLIHLVWAVTGVQAWSARLVAPLLALSALYLTRRLAVALWPEGGNPIGAAAVWLTFASLFWLLFLPLVQFDLLLTNAVLVAWLGLSRAPARPVSGWALVAAGVGLGALAKGPVALVFVLPPLLLAPYWLDRASARRWSVWYAGGTFGVLSGAAIALAWAIPAGESGGEAYRSAIFWGQSAGRVVDSFAHRSPWWAYAWMLPLLCLPWLAWPRLWRALRVRPAPGRGDRFLRCALLPALLILSLISAKQPKYLLPLLPLITLWLARLATQDAGSAWRSDRWVVAAAPALAAVLIVAAPHFADRAGWLAAVKPAWALLPAAVALALGLRRATGLAPALRALALSSAAAVVALNLALAPAARASFDLGEFSARIADLQARGAKVAYLGHYQGQFHFLGRLRRPLVSLDSDDTRMRWLAAYPDGWLVDYRRAGATLPPADLFARPWRGGRLVLWPVGRYLAAAAD